MKSRTSQFNLFFDKRPVETITITVIIRMRTEKIEKKTLPP